MTTPSSSPAKPRKKRSFKRRFCFGLFLFALITCLQEVVFRVCFPIPETTRFNRIRYQLLAESDPRFQPLLKRGLVYDRLFFESRPDGWSYTHRLNRFGFRERDFTIQPSPGRSRVVVVGDSITEGQGASPAETIPGRLGQKLGRGHEVLNLGVVAATLDKVTLLAAESAELLAPQTLVVVMYANDLPAPPPFSIASINSLESTSAKIRQEINAAEAQKRLPQLIRLGLRVMNDQPIYSQFFGSTIRYFAPEPDATNPFTNQPAANPKLSPELEKAMRAGEINPWLFQQSEAIPGMLNSDLRLGGSPEPFLSAIGQVCQRRNIRLIVAYVPFYGTINERYVSSLKACGMDEKTARELLSDTAYSRHSGELAEICKSLNIEFVDTAPALKKQEGTGTPQFWSFDSHPNPAGYETIAEAIFQAIGRK
jgi:lysophospholipase L1-like esterase